MKIKNTMALSLIALSMTLTAAPITANGSKDSNAEDNSIPEKSVLHISDRPPVGFGEGGGIGAGQRPSGFEEIPEGIISGKKTRTVTAELTTITGTLNVKGGKGNRKFTFKSDDGKTYNISVEESNAEHLAGLKNKKIKAESVFYGKDFLLFDFVPVE